MRKREGCKVRYQASSSSADGTQGKEQPCLGKLSSARGTQHLPSSVTELRARNQGGVWPPDFKNTEDLRNANEVLLQSVLMWAQFHNFFSAWSYVKTPFHLILQRQLKQYFIMQETRGTNKQTACAIKKKKIKTSPMIWFLYPNWLDWLPWHHVYQFHMFYGETFSNSQKRMPTKVKVETSRIHLLGVCIWLQHFVLCHRREVNMPFKSSNKFWKYACISETKLTEKEVCQKN